MRVLRVAEFPRAAARRAGLALLLLVVSLPSARADVRMPKVFSSHMVLQRDMPLPIWGWAAPGEEVTVRLASSSVRATADAHGEWKATLPPMKAGGPYALTATGRSTVTLDDVLVGEVWLCSGQSNMEMGIRNCLDADQEIAAADFPRIRLLMVPNRWTPLPMDDMEATWKVCTPTTVAEGGWGGFSGAAYYFGRELHRRLGVPVGLVDATWGGTVIQTWTPPEGFASVPALSADYQRVLLADPRAPIHRRQVEKTLAATEKWVADARKALAAGVPSPEMPTFPADLLAPHDVQNATALYNGMIRPLCPFAIRGAIWYQGESNLGEGRTYTERMKALVGGWRKVWDQGDFPFYYVQIAPFNYGGNPQVEPEFWEAQSAAQAIPGTGMAVINDVGDLADIHPRDKQTVGRRLALLALDKTYHVPGVVSSGPTPRAARPEGDRLRIEFDNAAGGLASRDGKPLTWFEIIDAEKGGFVKADARIDGDAVVLSAPGVERPVAVRYAWSMLAEPNLANGAGLPASAFRLGDVPKRDLLAISVPESKDYALVYDLDATKLGPNLKYDVDNHARITRPFDRIAYFLELQTADGQTQYVYVSMDAFTTDPGKIGVPTAASGGRFQQNVTNMNVLSNVKGIPNGTGLAGGNVELWPDNYGPTNSAGVPDASAQAFDFGDDPGDPRDGYGCMQVHDHAARQTLFALNNWKAGGGADVGIGNRDAPNTDWTFAANARTYMTARLRVLVRYR